MYSYNFGLQRYNYFCNDEIFYPFLFKKKLDVARFMPEKPYFCAVIRRLGMFHLKIESWYNDFGRDLPWRHTRDPYLIMLSEFILQQTQIVQGMSYYLRFAGRFPSAESLAKASEEEVMLYWQGLGYYSRARHLHAAAKVIAGNGCFPNDYGFVRALPGVGDYTAAAIMSFAFGAPLAVLDGNVQRVLARHFGITEPVDTAQGKKLLRALADEMLDRQHPALYNQAIMDFGALVCKPSTPVCERCPLAGTCQALREHLVPRLPVKAKRTARRDRYLTYIYVRTADGQTFLNRRGSGDIWQGLFEFPLMESPGPLSVAEVEEGIRRCLSCFFPGKALSPTHRLQLICQNVSHQLTHQHLHVDFYSLTLPSAAAQGEIPKGCDCGLPPNGQWIRESDINRYALPRLLEKLLVMI